ncbi:IS1182 family transposase [Sorangium sp. So ce448]|uniref:IS1182 family transposase n=1 Tax=Sorangium sp. So ce448 TaxID=3133314 RepID=UPI003F60779E
MERWLPPVELSRQEQALMKRLTRVRALFGFLRLHRHELFDETFQEQLESMYRTTGAGEPPHPPALMCMVTLLQGYVGASDAEAVELSIVDLRWQMVLGCLGAATPAFSQGALQGFRERMVEHEMDRVLLERTVALVRSGAMTEGERRAVSKALRVAVDSRPLAGAGRVEDTINLLGHAARSIVRVVSKIMERPPEEICRKAGIPLLLAPSIKAGLDLDWSDPKQKAAAIQILERQVSSLHQWVDRHLDDVVEQPLRFYLDAVTQVRDQDLETGEDGTVRIRQGVAADRRVSIEDAEMRHGRKSRSKRFDGYKEHIARDLDLPVIVACAVTPANRPEEEGAAPIAEDIRRQRLHVGELHIDRAYVNSPVVGDVIRDGGQVFSKPWGQRARNPNLFSKRDFKIDLRTKTITCPAGQVEVFEPGDTVQFDPEECGACPLRARCTQAASGRGRTVSIAKDEALQRKFRKLQQTGAGRAVLRQRVAVEHALAHIAARKGHTARYIGARRNLFDLRRAAAIQNLEAAQRLIQQAA